jgi:hypothetical protein
MKSTVCMVVLKLSIALNIGCTSKSLRSHNETLPAVRGMVRTEGALIKAKTLSIPSEGLTLIDVIERCERESMTSRSSSVNTSQRQAALAISGQQNNPIASASQRYSDALRKVQELKKNPLNAEEIAKAAESMDQAKTALIEQLDRARVTLPAENRVAVEGLTRDLVAQSDNQRWDEIFAKFNKRFLPATETASDRIVEEARFADESPLQLVVLTRRNGRRIIVPLSIVKGWIAGDIALADGDTIGIAPKEGFDAFTRAGGDENTQVTIAISGLTKRSEITTTSGNATLASFVLDGRDAQDELESFANIVVLQSLTPSGQIEEYILPMSEYPGFVGMKRELLQLASNLNLQDGDHLHFGALELTPLLLTSRAQNRELQARALRDNVETFGREQNHGALPRAVGSNGQGNSFMKNVLNCQQNVRSSVSDAWQSIPKPNLLALNPFE